MGIEATTMSSREQLISIGVAAAAGLGLGYYLASSQKQEAAPTKKDTAKKDTPPAVTVPKLSVHKGDSVYVMSGDVGGTNTRLMLYSVHPNEPIVRDCEAPGDLKVEKYYKNINFKELHEVIELFLKDAKAETGMEMKPVAVCLAVAGVVTFNKCRLTNVDWVVDGFDIAERLNCNVEVINDFVAQGYGILTLGDNDVTWLNKVPRIEGAPIACLGAGTGLGETFLTPGHDGEYECFPSEGGHAEFAPRGEGCDEVQMKLLKYLKIKYSGRNRVSVERVVSGPGLCNVYEFLAYTYPDRVDKDMHKKFLEERKDAQIISDHASTAGSLCEEALKIFLACYGSEAGVLGLKFMPFGGLYLTGASL